MQTTEAKESALATVDVSPETLSRRLTDVPATGRVVIVNLLRYRTQTRLGDETLSGREAYARYERGVMPLLVQEGGRPLWRGVPRAMLIGPEHERWDEMVLIEYRSRAGFEGMMAHPAYVEIVPLRSAVLADSRLIAVASPQRIPRVAWLLIKLGRHVRRLLRRT